MIVDTRIQRLPIRAAFNAVNRKRKANLTKCDSETRGQTQFAIIRWSFHITDNELETRKNCLKLFAGFSVSAL